MIQNLIIKIFACGLLIISAGFSFGQIYFPGNSAENYKYLKNATLYFVCPENMMDEEESLQTLLDAAWNYCDIKVIKYKDMKEYYGKNNIAFFSISRSVASDAPIQYVLWLAKDPSKNEMEYYPDNFVIARLHLNVNCQVDSFLSFNNMAYNNMEKEQNRKDQIMKYIYNSDIENMKPGILCSNLKILERELESKTKNWEGSSAKPNLEGLKNLKDETLYITKNVQLQLFSTGYRIKKLCVNRETNTDKLMKDYPYPYQLITFDELSAKLLKGDKFTYLMAFDYDATRRYMYIYNEEGECFYQEMLPEPLCTSKDFKAIAKLIGK